MENDLKNLGRMELLQVLLRVTESNEALMAENAELKSASSMQISRSAKVGSIAEEALRVNGFFEAAQRSADDYLREIMKLRDEMIEHSKAQAAAQAKRGALGVSDADQREQLQLFERIQDQAKTYIQDVQTYANNVMARANSQAQAMLNDARLRSEEIIAQANDQARVIIEEAEARVALKEVPLVGDLATEEAPEDEQVESEFPTEELEAVLFEAEDTEVVEAWAEEPEAEDPATAEPKAALPAEEEPAAGDSETVAPAADETIDEASEEVFEEGIQIEEPTAEGLSEEAVLGELPNPEEVLAEEPATEDAPADESQDEVKQTTAPLNIDVIVSDIAAAAFSEDGLDPNSTGALVRRGRHVKLSEGMAM